jgi:tungstate transport system ATP-binding protein
MLIQAEKLGLKVGEKLILHNISLGIERGEVLALIGPTGAGKTSLLRLLDLLEKPSSGRLLIDGMDFAASSSGRLEMRRRMAFVQQKPVAFNMSVFDNVASGLRWRGVDSTEARRRVDAVLELVGLAGYDKQNARTLSGGEMQRVAIARSLVTAPEILYLDEPTANLDPVTNTKIEEVLAHVARENKVTVVMSTHDMTQGQRLAGRVALLMNGRLIQIGTPHDIFTSPQCAEAAGFVGVDNIWPGVVVNHEGSLVEIRINTHSVQAVTDFETGRAVDVLIRPEDVTLSLTHDITSARNVFKGRVVRLTLLGPLARVEMDCGFPVLALVTAKSVEEMGLEPGKQLWASFKATSLRVIRSCG